MMASRDHDQSTSGLHGCQPQIGATPGSDGAGALGCTCPRSDNARGIGLPGGYFWIDGACPLHGYIPADRYGADLRLAAGNQAPTVSDKSREAE